MKRLTAILCALLAIQSSHALIVSVKGQGEVPAEGMNLLITEGEEDPLTERYTMALEGELLTTAPQITIRITRSATGLEDEFCCGSNCTAGNGQTQENKMFNVSGVVNWYAHYMPIAGSDETVSYVFDDGQETRELHVRYTYAADAVEQVNYSATAAKQMQNGQMFILRNGQTYSMSGAVVK